MSIRQLLSFSTIGSACAAWVPHVLLPRAENFSAPLTPYRIQKELGSRLTNGANLYFPGSEAFDQANHRWSTYEAPDFSVIVEAAVPQDISVTIQYANSVGKPFLARSGGHGSASTLASVQDGFQISLHQFKQVELAADGQSARLGGGLLVQEIIDGVDAFGKVTTTGTCGCVGIGAGLGGGYGRLQSIFGMIADNILEANVVLWNGTQVVVNENNHPDLFWGLRGAGHNFGIVTDLSVRVFDRPAETWFSAMLVFDLSAHDSLYEILQEQLDAGTPVELPPRFLFYAWNPALDSLAITLALEYIGSAADAQPYLAPFLALGPLNTTIYEAIPYTEVPTAGGTGITGEICTTATQHLQFSAYAQSINATAMREAVDLLADMFMTYPESRTGTVMLFETYSMQGVQAYPDDFNAFPHRDKPFVLGANIVFPDGTLPDDIFERGEAIRDAVRRGDGEDTPLSVYLNYALGTESLESVYGYDEWRLERLRALKEKYDPEGKFSHYMPIA